MRKLVLALLATLTLSGCGYNEFQRLDEATTAAWSEVVNNYQRRADLIPNLVATVKGAADFEKGTLEAVVNARALTTASSVPFSKSAAPLTVATRFGMRSARRW